MDNSYVAPHVTSLAPSWSVTVLVVHMLLVHLRMSGDTQVVQQAVKYFEATHIARHRVAWT